ncbi:MAG: hypothetical protein HY294_16160 [Candidatus Rokubacteria bacterium]|nr:hypothetical protein [Candidatus Rokubacteria bacterium]MBI3827527.1 hypothetical protein [Candidatus Rokubacteria bacterium]
MRSRLVLLALVTILALSVRAEAAPEQLSAVVHVHSRVSTGELSIDELARIAEGQGIAALLLTENYLPRVEYGLPPFRALTRIARSERGVLDVGIDGYLGQVDDARRRHPGVLLIPGVEVMPHYFWSGSLLTGHLTLHDTQKNLLVFGLDRRGLERLPTPGNPGAGHYTWQSLSELAPALLLVGGMVALRSRPQRLRVGVAVVVVRRRHWTMGLALAAIGVVALVRGWPFTVDSYPPWRDAGLEPHQAAIDYVDRLGGVTLWSFPEAWDAGRQRVGPIEVSWRTQPYADDLVRTFRYTGFGGLYEQSTKFERPGDGWDRVLVQYVTGERSRPAWATGESGFHGFVSGKRLGPIQTILLVTERSEAAVLDALKRGRMYALQRTPERALALGTFSAEAGAVSATSGETLVVPPGVEVVVSVAIEATDQGVSPLRVALVRNGVVAEEWTGAPPLRATHRERFNGAPLVFRVDARGPAPHRVLTNPIFVRPR